MGILERKLREREQRRQQILASARKIFLQKGIDTSSLQDIAADAELSKAALYLYFRDKATLLGELLAQTLGQLEKIHQEVSAQAKTGLDKLKAWGKAFSTLCLEHPEDFYFMRLVDLFSLPLEALDREDAPAFKLMSRFKKDIFKTFEMGIKDGSLRSDLDPHKTTMVLSQVFITYMQALATQKDQVKNNTGYSPEELIDHLFELLLHAIVPSSKGDIQ